MILNYENVRLRPMRQKEFALFRERFIRDWAQDIAQIDDLGVPEAEAKATERTDADLIKGIDTDGHFLFTILQDDSQIGTLWFSTSRNGEAFLQDITVEREYRGRGYGGRALELLEAIVSERGLTSIGLNVYTHNQDALRFYRRLGFRATGMRMSKRLKRVRNTMLRR